VPAAVRREVWARDNGQCAFVGAKGRCEERGFLEFHHVIPFAEGGEATAENLHLRCRAHNAYEARKQFGPLLLRERMEGYGDSVLFYSLRSFSAGLVPRSICHHFGGCVRVRVASATIIDVVRC
jgi:hypothetical protein